MHSYGVGWANKDGKYRSIKNGKKLSVFLAPLAAAGAASNATAARRATACSVGRKGYRW
jgi:hypothetical protein